jgi:porin
MVKKSLLLSTLILSTWLLGNIFAQDSTSYSNTKILSFQAGYTGDAVGNINGGIKRGAAYLGQINLGLTFDTKNAGLWNGGEFYLQLQNSHGQTPSATLVGDNQVFTNIENGNYTYLYELLYKQTFEKLWFKLGIIDLNTEFIITEEGLNFINSSFGVIPTISGNIPLSIFPKNALGLMLNYSITDAISAQFAIIDGDPGDLESDPYNLSHNLSKEQGLYYSGEVAFLTKRGTYKLCGYYHTGSFNDILNPQISKKHNFGAYGVFEQTLFEFSGDKKLNGFIQLGYAPTSRNLLDKYFGCGINFYSPFSRKDDIIGLAVAHASVNKDYFDANSSTITRSETAIELNYEITLNDYFSLQPNIQYIINPGMSKNTNNALVSTFRLNISL